MIRGGRISYIDALKGLLIILVIIGHSNVNLIVPRAVQAIYTVHMPLFFVLSGFFLHRNESIKKQLKKTFKNYIVPYVLTCLVCLATILAKWYLTQDLKYEGICEEYIKRSLFVQIARTSDIGPIWFLVALFWGQNILTFLLAKLSKIQLFCCIIVLAICSVMLSDKVFVPFSFFQGLTALPYLCVGFMLKTYREYIECIVKDKICLVLIGVLWAVYVLLGNVMRISFVDFPNGCTSYVVSLFASLVVLYYSKFIDFTWLRAIGRHTLLILCVHTLVLPYVSKIGSLHTGALYTSLEIIADVLISIIISFVIVKFKKVLVNGNTSKRS